MNVCAYSFHKLRIMTNDMFRGRVEGAMANFCKDYYIFLFKENILFNID